MSKCDIKEKDIIILTESSVLTKGMAKKDIWTACLYIVAYIDTDYPNEIKNDINCIEWVVTEKERAEGKVFQFKNFGIYIMKVVLHQYTSVFLRKETQKTVFSRLKSNENEVKNELLEKLLEKYNKPVTIKDKLLGSFSLDRGHNLFSGEVKWLGEKIQTTLEIDTEDKSSWESALKHMKKLVISDEKWDKDFRKYAAEKLTDLANDWGADDDKVEFKKITEEDFARRITITSISIDGDGQYQIYFNDDDMFWGHCVVVSGQVDSGIESAEMMG